MILPIVKYPDPILDQKSDPVKRVTKDLVELGRDLVETMKNANGLGLAAIQCGHPVRVIAMMRGKKSLLLFNPIIVSQSPIRRLSKEGCLSYEGVEYLVKRHLHVKVKYTDVNNKTKFAYMDGIDAIVVQHECDHLMGVHFNNIEDKIEITLDIKK